MVAIVLVGVIFIGTIVAVPAAISYTNFQVVDQQQLRNTALNVYNTLLQGTGTSSQWGSVFPFDENDVTSFGLALSDSLSKYVLDSDKVQRLDPLSPGFLTYDRVIELLKLQGYGFKFTLFRPFKVDWDINWDDQSNLNSLVSLDVNTTRMEDGAPVPNAEVRANIIVTAKNPAKVDDPLFIISGELEKFTDIQGNCKLNKLVDIPSGYVLETAMAVMHITVAGMETVVVASRDYEAQKWLRMYTFGDTVTLTFRNESMDLPEGSRKVQKAFGYDLRDLMEFYDGDEHGTTSTLINHGTSDYEFWSETFPGLGDINPAMLIFIVKVTGKYHVIAGPYAFSDPAKVFEFGPEDPTANVLANLRRFVVIDGMTYVTELVLWKD